MPGAGGQDGKTPNGENGQPTAEQFAAELASLRAALKAANAELATRRKKLDELEAAEEERKAAYSPRWRRHGRRGLRGGEGTGDGRAAAHGGDPQCGGAGGVRGEFL